jgi:hypothetical protein
MDGPDGVVEGVLDMLMLGMSRRESCNFGNLVTSRDLIAQTYRNT